MPGFNASAANVGVSGLGGSKSWGRPNASWGNIPTIQFIEGVFGLTLPNAEVFRYKFVS